MVIDLWAGDVDGDGRPEIVPSFDSGSNVLVLEDNLKLAWQAHLETEDRVGPVQGGDVDGDGQAEVVALSADWDLFLLESDGRQVWQRQVVPTGQSVGGPPTPRQLLLGDLNGDTRTEIVVLTGTTVHVFDREGRPIWQYPPDQAPQSFWQPHFLEGRIGALTAGDADGDGQAELLAAMPQQGVVYLLATDGRRLAEYRLDGITGALAYTDLNGDGRGEVIVGTGSGVQVFGAASQVERTELWRSTPIGSVDALRLADLEGDGQVEIVAGTRLRRVHVLATDGRTISNVPVEAPVLTLAAGDMDGDNQAEIAVGTWGGAVTAHIYLLEDSGPAWAVSAGLWVNSIAVRDERPLRSLQTAEAWPPIIAGVKSLDGSNAVLLLDLKGEVVWRQKFDEPVTAVGSDAGQALVGTQRGRVYRLAADGALVGEYDLGAKVVSLDQGLAATAAGQVYQLDGAVPTLIYDLGEAPTAIAISHQPSATSYQPSAISAGFKGGRFSLIAGDEVVWQGTVEGEVTSIAAEDVNGDGEVELAVGTDQGRIHLWSSAANQPPLLTRSDLAETRIGYTYSVDVNDPDGDAVTVTLEIWDPSAGLWLTQTTQSLLQDQTQGQLRWDVPDPFDTWDSGQESRFRFRYDDGHNQATLNEIPGPFTIPTLPWYVYYGQRIGLGALILMIPALGWLFYRRQWAYRRSPIGRAESLLKQLRAHPDEVLLSLHTVARAEPALLAYLPGLAREAGETAIADLSEGFQLILTRPEVAVEGMRAIVRRGGEEEGREEARR